MLKKSDIEKMVRVWQARMRLTHWTIKIDWDTLLDEGFRSGECEVSKRYDVATIRFGAGFPTWDRVFANQTVVHELLHVAGRDLDESVNAIDSQLSKRLFELFYERFEHENEGVIERTACVLVDLGGIV